MFHSFHFLAALAPAIVSAVPYPGPSPTIARPLDLAVEGWSPVMTSPARFHDDTLELFKARQVDDRTCGFINGINSLSLTCMAGYVCATNSIYDVAGCCDPYSLSYCNLRTSCVPYAEMSTCTAEDCFLNPFLALCSDTASPYCYNWLYNFGSTTMTEFGCGPTAWTSVVERTFIGEDTATEGYSYYSFTEVSVPTSIRTRIVSVTASGAGVPSSLLSLLSDFTATAAASSTDSSSGDSGGGSSSGKKKKSSIGAIAGGAAGGVAVLVAAVVGVVLLLKRRRAQKNAAAGNYQQPPMSSGPGPYPPPVQQPPYDPNLPQHNQQYPAPNDAVSGYYQPSMDQKPGLNSPQTTSVIPTPMTEHQNPMSPASQVSGGYPHPPYSPAVSPAPPPVPQGVSQLDGTPRPISEIGGNPVHPQQQAPPMPGVPLQHQQYPGHQAYEMP